MNNAINIIQWNCQGIRPKTGEFASFLNSLKVLPDVILLQETFLKSRHTFKLQGYQIERFDRQDDVSQGGILTCVRDGLSYSSVIASQAPQCFSTTVIARSRRLKIVNFYAPPGKSFSSEELEKILDHQDAIICGDMNAHSPIFGARHSDRRGKIVEDLTHNLNLVVLNTGEGTHLVANGGTSPIDISLASPYWATKTTWKVLNKSLGSDHYIIKMTINDRVVYEALRSPRVNLKTLNWNSFHVKCLASIAQELPSNDLEENTRFITDSIAEAAKNSSTTYKGHQKRPLVPYWTDDCKKAVKVRNRKRAIYRRLRCESSFEEYKRAKGHAQWIIKSAKRACWQKHCASFDGSTGLATLWRTIKGLNGNCSGPRIPPIASDSGSPLGNTEKAETLARSFALASSNANLSPHFAHIKSQHQLNPELFLPDDSHLSDPISISEVYDALRRCGNSSPGPDGIHYEMLRRLPLMSLEGILALFNQSWSSGVVPHSWRRAIVAPILKKGKLPSLPSSYRPISLTSTLCKLLERVIATRLRWFLESKNMLNQYQAGFRKGRGCVDHIVRLTQDIAASSTKKQMTLAVFLDLEKTFDMVWREGIIEQLSKMGVKGKPLEWIHNFLQDRSIQVRVGSALSEPVVVENGTPQGSVLSPLLFIIMMNGIPNPCKGVELSMYADDIALWTTGTSSRAMTTRMQKQLNKTAKFLSANGFKISASKSQAVLFTNSRVKRSEANIRLRIGKEQIPLSPTATFLGIVLDARLSWSAHAEAVKTRCMKRLNAMRAISGSS